MGNQRECGVLLPISSLPSKYGIGCFSKSAYEFVDQLKAAGQGCWQILPLGPTSYGDSPYQSFSTFAGNPYFISLEDLIEEGVLTEKECDAVDFGSREDDVDYEKIYKGRYKLLRKAYERSDISKNPDFVRFQQEQAHWLGDYALFMAVKDRFEGIPWTEWAEDIRLRWNNALDYYRKELYFEIEFQEYMQFKFYEQWAKLKAYANRRGIRIIGDIPIYVAMDSADTWANPGLFKLDENNEPTQVAGCPPDGFSEQDSFGEILCTDGMCIKIPDSSGGSNVWHIALICMMLSALIISVDLMNIMRFHMVTRMQNVAGGKKDREWIFSAPFPIGWDTRTLLLRTLVS